MHVEVGHLQKVRYVFAVAPIAGPVCNTQLGDPAAEPVFVGTVAHDMQGEVGILAGDVLKGLEQDVDALMKGYLAREQDDAPPVKTATDLGVRCRPRRAFGLAWTNESPGAGDKGVGAGNELVPEASVVDEIGDEQGGKSQAPGARPSQLMEAEDDSLSPQPEVQRGQPW